MLLMKSGTSNQSFQLSSTRQSSLGSHLGTKLSSSSPSSNLLGYTSTKSFSKPYSTTTSSLFQRTSTKKSKSGTDEGHRDIPKGFEIPLPDYDFHLEDGDFSSLDESEEVVSFPTMDAQELGIEVSIVDISAKKVSGNEGFEGKCLDTVYSKSQILVHKYFTQVLAVILLDHFCIPVL